MSSEIPSSKALRANGLDFFLASLAPALIIGMIGSLVFFLVSVCYDGSFQVRLQWNLGLYTAAAVLVARIAIEQSRPRAIGYLAVLAASALWMTPHVFAVPGPLAVLGFPILVMLLALIAFLADRVTFDCALISERSQSSGIGLLQSLGVVKAEPEQKRKRASGVRRHNPGVWVLYFALMALPVFGFGQLFLTDPAERRWGYLCLFGYLTSSFCLLVMIALLSLRKYLRERGVPMETAFAMRWLAIGFTSVCVVLGLLFWIPLPSESLLTLDLPFKIADREDLQAHPLGWGDEGIAGDKPKVGKPQDQRPNADQANNSDEQKLAQKQVEMETALDSANGRQFGSSDNKSDTTNAQKKDGEDNDVGDAGDVGDARKSAKKIDDGKQPRNNAASDRKEQAATAPAEQRDAAHAQANAPEQKANERINAAETPKSWPSLDWNISATLRWLFMLLLVIVAIVCGMIYRKDLLVAASDFVICLQRLFGLNQARESPSVANESATQIPDPYPPFGSFSNPFAAGQTWTREQIVRHIYRACLSWGYERRIVRRDDETPEEFLRRLAKRFPEQQDSIGLLGTLYNRIAYARGKVSSDELPAMKSLWKWFVQSDP